MKITTAPTITTETGTYGRASVEALDHEELMSLTINDLLAARGYVEAARTASAMSVALVTTARDACPAVIFLSTDPKAAGKELVKKLKRVKRI